MKTTRNRFKLLVATISIAALGIPSIKAQNVSRSPQLPAGASSAADSSRAVIINERWRNFLKLAAQPNGAVDLREFENAFGQKSVFHGNLGSYNFNSIQGFVTLNLRSQNSRITSSNQISTLVIFDFTDSLNPAICISSDQARRDVLSAGWVLRSHFLAGSNYGDIREAIPADAPYGLYTFAKDDQGTLLLGYSEKTNCATKVTMNSDKRKFDQINHAKSLEDAQ
jgi:hypothetical protein